MDCLWGYSWQLLGLEADFVVYKAQLSDSSFRFQGVGYPKPLTQLKSQPHATCKRSLWKTLLNPKPSQCCRRHASIHAHWACSHNSLLQQVHPTCRVLSSLRFGKTPSPKSFARVKVWMLDGVRKPGFTDEQDLQKCKQVVCIRRIACWQQLCNYVTSSLTCNHAMVRQTAYQVLCTRQRLEMFKCSRAMPDLGFRVY